MSALSVRLTGGGVSEYNGQQYAWSAITNGDAPGRAEAPAHAEPDSALRQHSHTLVLNASMEPLCVVPTRRAIVLMLTSKADLLHAGSGLFRAERTVLPAPSVVRLRRYVHVPYRRRAALSRRGVFLRDASRCQ
jgi:hypothetical protein